ncbi:hypothetical protein PENTCL1PPCAC_23030, partial [Pristionchus entomophagus]
LDMESLLQTTPSASPISQTGTPAKSAVNAKIPVDGHTSSIEWTPFYPRTSPNYRPMSAWTFISHRRLPSERDPRTSPIARTRCLWTPRCTSHRYDTIRKTNYYSGTRLST